MDKDSAAEVMEGQMMSGKNRVSLEDYQRAQTFLTMVKRSRTLTPQQKSTLRRQALHGDLEGARKGYEKIMRGMTA